MAAKVSGTEAKAKSSVSGLSPIDTVLRALEACGCKPRSTGGNQWVAKCPSHDDRRPSLSIAEGSDGRVLLHCHAGCSPEDVCGALGLDLRELFPANGTKNPSAGKGSPKPSAKPAVFPSAKEAVLAYGLGRPSSFWVYKDAQGQPVAVVARWDTAQGKEIRPVVRDTAGWKWGAPPEPRPLYRLPELLAASPEVPVVVVEGEKTAEAAVKCGLTAVTSWGGAKAASKTDWSPLGGRKVIILPDKDEAGEGYAETVVSLCRKAGAASVKILRLADYCNLPEHGDLADIAEAPDRFGLPVGKAELGRWILETAETLPEAEIDDFPQVPLNWEPYPTEYLPPVLAEYIREVANCLGCDPSQVALPLIVAAASAIGTTRLVQVKRGWQVFPILWGAVIGESGSLKTPAFQKAIAFVQHYQHKLAETYEQQCRDYETALQDYETRLAKWKRNPDSEEPPEKPPKPICRRVLTNDTTIEALALLLRDNPRGLLVACDELSTWLGSFGRYSRTGNREAEIGHWTSLYHGQPFHVDRKTSGFLYVPMAAASIVGLIQPRILRESLTSSDLENGVAARFLFVRPPSKVKQWTDKEENPELVAAVERVFSRLYSLEHAVSPEGKLVPRRVELSREAREAYKAFYNRHNEAAAEFTGSFRSALAKLEELPIRLGLVIHLVRWASGEPVNPDIIDVESMEKAIRLTEWHIRETQRFYEWFREHSLGEEDQRLLEWISEKGGEVSVRDVTHGLRQFRGKADEAEAALQRLVERGLGTWENVRVSQKGGRPKRVFRVHDLGRCHQNLKNSRDSRSFGDGDTKDYSEQQEQTSPNPKVMPPESGGAIIDKFSPIGKTPKPGEWVEWRV